MSRLAPIWSTLQCSYLAQTVRTKALGLQNKLIGGAGIVHIALATTYLVKDSGPRASLGPNFSPSASRCGGSMRRDAHYLLCASKQIKQSLPPELLVFGVSIGIIHMGTF